MQLRPPAATEVIIRKTSSKDGEPNYNHCIVLFCDRFLLTTRALYFVAIFVLGYMCSLQNTTTLYDADVDKAFWRHWTDPNMRKKHCTLKECLTMMLKTALMN